jgi:biopolymer transport protein ExbB
MISRKLKLINVLPAGLLGVALLLAGLLSPVGTVNAQVVSLDDLLKQVQQGRVRDNQENAEREKRFEANKAQRAKMLADMKAERARQEARSTQLEAQFDLNDQTLNDMRAQLAEELGDLKELFGVIQQTAAEAQVNFDTSLTSSQFLGRSERLQELAAKMGQSNQLISLEEIESIWYELQREMTEQGKVARFTTEVSDSGGERSDRTVVRVGVFNAVSDGQFLKYSEGSLSELVRQPQRRYLSQAGDLQDSQGGFTSFSLDPTSGTLLAALVESPSLVERIQQGGIVGYVIIVMGAIALVIAVWRILTLTAVGSKVKNQVKNLSNPSTSNPLGRVLKVYQDNPSSDVESMELKLGEAILKETPKLNSWLMFLKIIAVVAPLMGLLGTVTGMIVTFQSITLYGAGDPKMMAGGISQALVTTVLGLVVAIPTVLLHTAASSRARRVQEILEEQSAGMIANQGEQQSA